MAQMIKVYSVDKSGLPVKEVTPQEAQKILEDTYHDGWGGFVVDGKTSQIIWEIGPNVEEIIIIPEAIGGG